MGRDIRVESKHFRYCGSKSSDLLMLFDYFFMEFPEYQPEDYDYSWCDTILSRYEMEKVLEFAKKDVKARSTLYRDGNELIEKLNNIYIRMMPDDVVEVVIV